MGKRNRFALSVDLPLKRFLLSQSSINDLHRWTLESRPSFHNDIPSFWAAMYAAIFIRKCNQRILIQSQNCCCVEEGGMVTVGNRSGTATTHQRILIQFRVSSSGEEKNLKGKCGGKKFVFVDGKCREAIRNLDCPNNTEIGRARRN